MIVLGGDQELAQQQKQASTSASSGTATGGIAEVTLPESFKTKNIVATVQATEKLKHIDYLSDHQNKRSRAEQSGYYQRFHQEPSNNTFSALTSSSFLQSATAELGLVDDNEQDMNAFTAVVSSALAAATGPLDGKKGKAGELKSSDDQALNKFRKVSLSSLFVMLIYLIVLFCSNKDIEDS
jgi:hypothetical protein